MIISGQLWFIHSWIRISKIPKLIFCFASLMMSLTYWNRMRYKLNFPLLFFSIMMLQLCWLSCKFELVSSTDHSFGSVWDFFTECGRYVKKYLLDNCANLWKKYSSAKKLQQFFKGIIFFWPPCMIIFVCLYAFNFVVWLYYDGDINFNVCF